MIDARELAELVFAIHTYRQKSDEPDSTTCAICSHDLREKLHIRSGETYISTATALLASSLQEATRAKDERIAELEKALNSLTARWLKAYHAGKKLNPHENPSACASADTFGECAEQLQTMIHHVLSNTSPPLQGATEEGPS
jgi:hypothetical protein